MAIFLMIQSLNNMNYAQNVDYLLQLAIRNGGKEQIQHCIRRGANPNAVLWKQSMLERAVENACIYKSQKYLDCVEVLLQHGANANYMTIKTKSLLIDLVLRNYLFDGGSYHFDYLAKCCSLLFQYGAEKDISSLFRDYGYWLHYRYDLKEKLMLLLLCHNQQANLLHPGYFLLFEWPQLCLIYIFSKKNIDFVF